MEYPQSKADVLERAISVNIKNSVPDRTLCIAPMMGYTDRHFRYLMRLISPHAFLYTEMIVANALIHGNAAHFLQHADDAPCAMQLGGSDPDVLAKCALMVEEAGYQEINLNVGCPSDRVQYGGIGACLMAEKELVKECVSAMQDQVSLPVTVKCRIGIDDKDSFTFFSDFVRTVAESGCSTFIVHARKAVLKGFSPRENRNIPPLKYEYVYRIKEELPDVEFILNGEVHRHDAENLLTRVHGLMVGREAYRNPWWFSQLEKQLFKQAVPDRMAILENYMAYIEENLTRGVAFKHMAKHLLGFWTGCQGARKFRRILSEKMFEKDAGINVIREALMKSGCTESD